MAPSRRGRVLLCWFSLANRMAIQIGMIHTNKFPEFPGQFSSWSARICTTRVSRLETWIRRPFVTKIIMDFEHTPKARFRHKMNQSETDVKTESPSYTQLRLFLLVDIHVPNIPNAFYFIIIYNTILHHELWPYIHRLKYYQSYDSISEGYIQ